MTLFPLFKRPGRLVFLDDDAFFLDVLTLACADEWVADYFQNTPNCLTFLESQKQAWLADAWLQREMHTKVQAGHGMMALVLDYWHQQPERYNLTHLIAVDYAMPGLNGLDALLSLKDWPAWRVLLTGQADEALAIKAFNAKVIDQFISKESMTLGLHLKSHLNPLLATPISAQQELWRQGLDSEQQQTLANSTVVAAITAWVESMGLVEYVVLSQPFGLLGLTSKGRAYWLQLELIDNLPDLVSLLTPKEQASVDIAAVLRAECLVNIELQAALMTMPLTTQAAIPMGDGLIAAVYDLGDRYAMPEEHAYRAWRERFPSQRISSK